MQAGYFLWGSEELEHVFIYVYPKLLGEDGHVMSCHVTGVARFAQAADGAADDAAAGAGRCRPADDLTVANSRRMSLTIARHVFFRVGQYFRDRVVNPPPSHTHTATFSSVAPSFAFLLVSVDRSSRSIDRSQQDTDNATLGIGMALLDQIE